MFVIHITHGHEALDDDWPSRVVGPFATHADALAILKAAALWERDFREDFPDVWHRQGEFPYHAVVVPMESAL